LSNTFLYGAFHISQNGERGRIKFYANYIILSTLMRGGINICKENGTGFYIIRLQEYFFLACSSALPFTKNELRMD
jgi:hypothetical protein